MAKSTKPIKKETFRLIAPDAKRVLLVGDFTDWQKGAISMKNGSNGLWTASVNLGPGAHSYLFIVDGEWCADPECALRVANPFGGENAICRVGKGD